MTVIVYSVAIKLKSSMVTYTQEDCNHVLKYNEPLNVLGFVNDPSTGSPTETLLRLLLSLYSFYWLLIIIILTTVA